MPETFGYLDREGQPIGALRWAELFEDDAYRFLKRETLANGRYVVTIWGGIISPVVPGLYSTGVFTSAPNETERLGKMLEERAYGSELDALQGHQELVTKWSAAAAI